MLILTRKPGEAVVINDNIEVVVVSIEGGQIRLGINAPSSVRIHRKELYEKIQNANREAATQKQSIPQLSLPKEKPKT
jgi:carbon storage regulator